MMNNNDNILVEQDVLDETSKKNNRAKTLVICVFVLLCLVVSLLAFLKLNQGYVSVDALNEAYPNGVTEDKTFKVQGKLYKYNTQNKAFQEVQQLSSEQADIIESIDISLDTSKLDELKNEINSVNTDMRETFIPDYYL